VHLKIIGTRNLKLLSIHGFIFAFGDGFFFLTLPVYITQLKASPTDLGWLYAVFYLSWGITLFIGGFLADRFDARKIIIIGTLLWLPLPLTLAVASSWTQLWLPMILYGTYFGSSSIFVFLLRSASSGRTMQAFGLWSGSWALGYVFSPVVGGYISQTVGKQTIFILSAIFTIASISPLFFLSKPPKAEEKNVGASAKLFLKDILSQKKLIALCTFFAAVIFSIYLIEPFIPKFMNEQYNQSIFNLGIFGTSLAVGDLFFSFYLGKLGDSRSKIVSVTAAATIYICACFFILAFKFFPVLCFASFLTGTAPCIWNFVSGVVGSAAPKCYVGKWIAFSQTTLYFSSFAASIIGGMLYNFSPYLAFFVTMLLLSVLIITAFFKKL
jgi:MFS family permease